MNAQLIRRVQAFLAQPGVKPGAYNLPEFTEFERASPLVLDLYAHHVFARQQSPAEVDYTRKAIPFVVDKFAASVSPNDLHRKCMRATYAVLALLEAAGVWAFAVHGSIGFGFESTLKLEPQFFWAHDRVDSPGGTAGHYWLVAPPFRYIDVTAKHQAWRYGEGAHVPSVVLAEKVEEVAPTVELHAPAELYFEFPPPGPSHHALWSWLSPVKLTAGPVRMHAQPYAIRVPPADEGIDGITLKVGGKSLRRFFDEDIAPGLAALR